jgi:uncharacterized OB-fold protein
VNPPDWTDGQPRLVVTRCGRCGNHWYLPRVHCPVCGGAASTAAPAAGSGLCVAVTRLHVTADGSDPIALGLVELDEGPTVMGRVHDETLAPGHRARVAFLGSPALPSFSSEGTR